MCDSSHAARITWSHDSTAQDRWLRSGICCSWRGEGSTPRASRCFKGTLANDRADNSIITECDFLPTTSCTSFTQVPMSRVISVTRDKQSQGAVSVWATALMWQIWEQRGVRDRRGTQGNRGPAGWSPIRTGKLAPLPVTSHSERSTAPSAAGLLSPLHEMCGFVYFPSSCKGHDCLFSVVCSHIFLSFILYSLCLFGLILKSLSGQALSLVEKVTIVFKYPEELLCSR